MSTEFLQPMTTSTTIKALGYTRTHASTCTGTAINATLRETIPF